MTKEEAQSRKEERIRRKKQAKNQRLVFLCVCLAILGIAVATAYSKEQAIREQQQYIAQLKEEVQAAAEYNDALRLQLEYMKTREYFRSVAREQLGLMQAGEIRFVEKP